MSNTEKHEGDSPSESDSPIPQKSQQPGGILGFFSRLGNLPEYNFGKKKLEGISLNWSIGFVASCGFLMFGYDQGVMSALLTLDDFQRALPLMTPFAESNSVCFFENGERNPAMCTGDANTQAAGVAIYQIGCFMGALAILFYGETWGRKSSTFWGSWIMVIGTIMQAACFGYGLFVAGRIIGGIGNGMVTSSECDVDSKPFALATADTFQPSRHGSLNALVLRSEVG